MLEVTLCLIKLNFPNEFLIIPFRLILKGSLIIYFNALISHLVNIFTWYSFLYHNILNLFSLRILIVKALCLFIILALKYSLQYFQFKQIPILYRPFLLAGGTTIVNNGCSLVWGHKPTFEHYGPDSLYGNMQNETYPSTGSSVVEELIPVLGWFTQIGTCHVLWQARNSDQSVREIMTGCWYVTWLQAFHSYPYFLK